MKWRKLLALVLACVLTLSLGAGALAADADEDALQAVTLKVKNVLGLDTEAYTSFDGWPSEDARTGQRWYLSWSGDGIYLSVTCDAEGKIYSYNKSESAPEEPDSWYRGRFTIPPLPTGSGELACAAAQSFLDKVLEKGVESIQLEDDSVPSLYNTTYRFGGTVLLNGIPSPITCSVTVRAGDNEVLRFWRSDQSAGYAGTLPPAVDQVGDAQVRIHLRAGLTMDPYYVLGEDGKTATVQYLPLFGDEYYVDAQTSQPVNLTKLREKLWSGDAFNKNLSTEAEAPVPTPEDSLMAGGATLSQAELDGAAKLAGAKSKEDLDRALKNSWPELGLNTYTLASASYSTYEVVAEGSDEVTYDVTCRLTYGLKTDEGTARRYVTVNAKTGELISVNSYRPIATNTGFTVYRNHAEEKARAALAIFAKGNETAMKLFDSTEAATATGNAQHVFIFCQEAYGYFYRSNSYTVGIDAVDGTISHLYGYFDPEVELLSPGNPISPDVALTAYLNALDVSFRYVEVPVAVNLAGDFVEKPLPTMDYDYVLTLKPGYIMVQPEDHYVRAIDARTGEVLQEDYTPAEPQGVTYDDVEGAWVQEAAETLARYQVGFPGGSLCSAQALTQLDMLTLLASVNGYQFDPTDASQDSLDWFYSYCYSLGLVTPETRDEDKLITRGDLVRLILDGAGYKKIAAMEGIFHCDFSDAADIPAADFGYAALAQGLGLVRGGSDGAYAAQRTATRGEAIAMLYQYMK